MEPYTDAKMDARKYLYEKYLKESDPSANRNLKPERNLHSPEAMAEAGYTPPQRYTAPEEKEEPGLLTKAWNALFGDSEEDIKAQQFNNAQYQKGLAEGKAEGLVEGERAGVIKTAKNLLTIGIDIEAISQATGLSMDEIKRLSK